MRQNGSKTRSPTHIALIALLPMMLGSQPRTAAASEVENPGVKAPLVCLDQAVAARAVPALVEWTSDGSALISLEVAYRKGWFRVYSATGDLLNEYPLPAPATYHDILLEHQVIFPGDMRVGVAFSVEDAATATVKFSQHDPAPDAPGTASGTVRFALSGDKSTVAVGYGFPRGGQPVTLYDTKTWSVLRTLAVPAPGPTGVGAMRMSNDVGRLAYAAADGIYVVDLESGAVIRRFDVGSTSEFAFSPDGKALAIVRMVESDQKIAPSSLSIYRIVDGEETASIKSAGWTSVSSLRWSPQGIALAFIVDGRTFHFWDLTGIAPHDSVVTLESTARSLAFSPDGNHLAVGDGPSIKLFKVGGCP